MNMYTISIKISTCKSMAAIRYPYGKIVLFFFEVKHIVGDIRSLIGYIQSIGRDQSNIVMKHTRRYYEALVWKFSQANLFMSMEIAKLLKCFGDNSLRKGKSDRADTVKTARYTLVGGNLDIIVLWMKFVIN